MTKFIITRIESGKVYAREKNPYDKLEQCNSGGQPFEINDNWYRAESSLKEYPLSEESERKIGDLVWAEFIIGQEISGEVVNGEIHIK